MRKFYFLFIIVEDALAFVVVVLFASITPFQSACIACRTDNEIRKVKERGKEGVEIAEVMGGGWRQVRRQQIKH